MGTVGEVTRRAARVSGLVVLGTRGLTPPRSPSSVSRHDELGQGGEGGRPESIGGGHRLPSE